MQRDIEVKVIVPSIGLEITLYKKGLNALEQSGSLNELLYIVEHSSLDGRFSWNELFTADKSGRAKEIFNEYAAVYGL